MRGYFFGNLYLSSIQQGIQAKHCGDEMFIKYAPRFTDTAFESVDADKYRQLMTYHNDHKTVICLNGGYSKTLHEIYALLEDDENPYPFAKFHESEEALDGALTCVGIVVPDAIYETATEVRNAFRERGASRARDDIANLNQYGEWRSDDEAPVNYTFTKFQVWLINELNKYGLAK